MPLFTSRTYSDLIAILASLPGSGASHVTSESVE